MRSKAKIRSLHLPLIAPRGTEVHFHLWSLQHNFKNRFATSGSAIPPPRASYLQRGQQIPEIRACYHTPWNQEFRRQPDDRRARGWRGERLSVFEGGKYIAESLTQCWIMINVQWSWNWILFWRNVLNLNIKKPQHLCLKCVRRASTQFVILLLKQICSATLEDIPQSQGKPFFLQKAVAVRRTAPYRGYSSET